MRRTTLAPEPALDEQHDDERGEPGERDERRDGQPQRLEQREVDAVPVHDLRPAHGRREQRPEGRAGPHRDRVAEQHVEHAVHGTERGHPARQLDGAAERDLPDHEPVVRRDADHDRVRERPQQEHHEPTGDPPDDDPGQRARGCADEDERHGVAGVGAERRALPRRLWCDRRHGRSVL